MPEPLETLLSQTLKAEGELITEDILRRKTLPMRRSSKHRAMVLTYAAFVAVIALTFGTFVIARSSHNHDATNTTSFSISSITDTKWRLNSVQTNGTITTVPSSVGAFITLSSDGQLQYNDGANFTSGQYRATANGFDVVGHPDITGAGAPGDRLLQIVVTSLDHIRSAAPGTISAMVTDGVLTLRVRETSLLFTNGGPITPPGPPATTT